jgi:putative DNA primase/helicase
MLRIENRELLDFAPSYRRRNKLAVKYQAGAGCPLFLDTLLKPALSPDDIELLQRWCGLALIGVNMAQRFLILTGTAGGGKGTFIRVINGIIGPSNVGTLRPDLLAERFELGRLLGKTLLYGADVPDNFLNCKGASVLKSLTGGDPVTLEFKVSNERPEIICRFNAIVTCNSRLKVHLEGDAAAWRRRLAIVEYRNEKPAVVVADLSERILKEEGAGVLNWMLAGLDKIRADEVEREAAESLARRKGVDWAARQEEHREEEWRVRGELLAMGREAVERWRKNAARCGSLEGIARLMELASKLGRLSSGMPTDCTQTKGELDVTVDVEFEAALKKAYGVLADGHNADGHAAIGKTIEAEIVGQKTLPEVSHD